MSQKRKTNQQEQAQQEQTQQEQHQQEQAQQEQLLTDIPVVDAVDANASKKRIARTVNIDKLSKEIITAIRDSPLAASELCPTAFELQCIIKPTLSILKRYGLLSKATFDNIMTDIATLSFGVTLYGIRVSSLIKAKQNKHSQDAFEATNSESEANNTNASSSSTSDRSSANGSIQNQSRILDAMFKLAQQDYYGRRARGYL